MSEIREGQCDGFRRIDNYEKTDSFETRSERGVERSADEEVNAVDMAQEVGVISIDSGVVKSV